MDARQQKRILARRASADLVGRTAAFDRLLAQAKKREGFAVLGTPGAGASELLRQVYDRLFHEQTDVAPFYFQVAPALAAAPDVAESFLTEFIRQLVAFRRRESDLVRSAAGLDELAELSVTATGVWIDRLIATARNASDGRAYIRTCLAAPVRAAASDAPSLVIVDDVHQLLRVDGGVALLTELIDIFSGAGVPFVVAGHRRFVYRHVNCERIGVDNLDFGQGGVLTEVLARENGVALSDAARDLVATQLAGNASFVSDLIAAARDEQSALDTFSEVGKVYGGAVLEGRIGRRLDASFDRACVAPEVKHAVMEMLFDMQRSGTGRMDRALWQRRLRLEEVAFLQLLDRLNWSELVRLTPVSVELMSERLELRDHIEAVGRLAKGDNRAAVFGDSLKLFLKRAPELLESRYRVNLSLGVRDVLAAFSGQTAPAALLDYAVYRKDIKGASPSEAEAALAEGDTIALPRIFFTTAASAYYKPLLQLAEAERGAIALGFETGSLSTEDEVVWIAAEVDSKLEASRELTELWCDRLEAAARECKFEHFRIWLIAPEGFTHEALNVLRSRNAIGSNHAQVKRLREYVHAQSTELGPDEYEIVVPMEEDAELIAANAVEEVARRHKLAARDINQIKTALVEACINASEHSLSPDRKIYVRFRVEDEGAVLTVSNRGLKLTASGETEEESPEGRRGWGLKLMRQLMDEVTVERVDDGTRIVMTKYLEAA